MRYALKHHSAKASHYDDAAKRYDVLNGVNSKLINHTITKLLKQHNTKTVLDMTCGTGSQVLWLAKNGFAVRGSDINAKMLRIARSNARKANTKIHFVLGDMRSLQLGEHDAVITIFNAIGHLMRADFLEAMANIRLNLRRGGIYMFDIFNLEYLIKGTNITLLTIDWLRETGSTKIRKVQYSTIDRDGILTSFTTIYTKNGNQKTAVASHTQTLQVYSAKQLRDMLMKSGFTTVRQCKIDGSRFSRSATDRIFTLAKAR